MQHTKSGTYFGVLQVSYDKTDPGCDIGQVTGLVSEVGGGRYLQITMAALDIIVLLRTKEMNRLFKAVQQGKFLQILNCKLAVIFCIQNLSNLKLLGGDLFAISGASGICFFASCLLFLARYHNFVIWMIFHDASW